MDHGSEHNVHTNFLEFQESVYKKDQLVSMDVLMFATSCDTGADA